MAEKYVRCNSHCKYPAYDKEEIDNLFYKKTEVDSKITEINEKYAVFNYTTTVRESASNGVYNAPIMTIMPEGFTPTNSVVISKMFGIEEQGYYVPETTNDRIDVALLTLDDEGQISYWVNGSLGTTDTEKAGKTYNIRIVFMKI